MKSENIIIFFPSIEKGGADKNLFMISNFLSSKLDNVSILTCSPKYRTKFKNIKYIGPKSKFYESFNRAIKTFISIYYLVKVLFVNKKVTILSFQSNLFSIIIGKLFSAKVITRSNSFPDDWTNNILKKKIFKFVYKLADRSIVNSIEVKKKFKKFYSINAVHIYNPVDKYKIVSLSKKKIKNLYKHKNSLKLIIVGRLSKEKDHITFLKSLKILLNKIKFEAVILGSGSQKNIINDKIHKYNLQNFVKIISFKSNPYSYINQSDILVLTSLHEGLPNILIEAAVLKTFVISSDCETGPKEILLNGKSGALFKVSNFKQLAKKILYFSGNKKIMDAMVNINYSNLHRFDFNKNLKAYLKIIKTVN